MVKEREGRVAGSVRRPRLRGLGLRTGVLCKDRSRPTLTFKAGEKPPIPAEGYD